MTGPIVLKHLLDAYVEINRMKACEPGEKSHMLAYSLRFLERRITGELKVSRIQGPLIIKEAAR